MGHLWRKRPKISTTWKFVFILIQFGAPTCIAIIGLYARKPSQDIDKWLNIQIAIALVALTVMLIRECFERYYSNEKDCIDSILCGLDELVWNRDKLSGPLQQHRITLFQLKRRRWWKRVFTPCWTHILVPRTRIPPSGPRPQRTFRVNHRDAEYCEGVAGLVFHNGKTVMVSEPLPNLHSPGVTDEVFKNWAELTNDKWKIAKKRCDHSRRIGGVTIYLDQERWGVIVVDSSDPLAVDAIKLNNKHMQRTLAMLGSYLDKVKP